MAPGEWLGLHRHDPDETYYVIEGRGVVTLDGVNHDVRPGSAVFIPGGVEHGVRCGQGPNLRFYYSFAADAFSDIEYQFSGGSSD
jgi:mannose-6-phosphate isomerase-like protein (cupin superfamily)